MKKQKWPPAYPWDISMSYNRHINYNFIFILGQTLPKTTRLIQGDRNAHKVLECLSYVASLYGEQVILLQYLPCIVDMVIFYT